MSAAEQFRPHYKVEERNHWEGDWELWAGVPVAMSPSPSGRHQAALVRLAHALSTELEQCACAATVLVELDWVVSSDTVVRPDLVVVCGPPPEGHLHAAPALAAEIVSPQSSERDRRYKRDLYDEQGVGTYLVIDPAAHTCEAYFRDAAGAWERNVVDSPVSLELCGDCRLKLDPAMLFRSVER